MTIKNVTEYLQLLQRISNLPTTNSCKIPTDEEIDEAFKLAKHFARCRRKIEV